MSYLAAQNLEDALAAMASGDASIVAGGTDFYPARRKGQADGPLVDITRISELRCITQQAGGWRIGGAATWTDVLRANLPGCFDGLKAAAKEVGSVQIQNVGTIAGNLCNASPAADGVPALLTLDAQVELTSATGVRVLPLADFITGVRRTARSDDEILTSVLVSDLPTNTSSYFCKLGSRKYLVISITMVAVIVGVDAAGRIDFARIAIGACSPVAQRQPELEQALMGQFLADVQITFEQLQHLAAIDDIRGEATYRLAAAAELCNRALQRCAQ